ncbi:hypothetical protein K458DRAFT_440834 [Lentithecium fluviatile CBS 122367]|uniref:Uncharacterized protein n=1 Tax=Lentithecium fluviatile CBS 122367 TaxID=1168545 RepID=A0A6G1JDC9_9PLEO|nr:hypothetical protein K458DRAFT_440834 [Lentithecium fluviatile CBS 122367]
MNCVQNTTLGCDERRNANQQMVPSTWNQGMQLTTSRTSPSQTSNALHINTCVVQLPVNILEPFYIYPEPRTWDRLHHAVIKHPTTNFTVILNIDNGPGITAWPTGKWTIGYIDTEGRKRDNASVREDIARNAGWSNSEIAIHGIYFNHTPTSDVDGARTYLKNFGTTVRHEEGFLEPKVVVHNPGMVPDANMTSYHADITVVFESEYRDLPNRKDVREKLKTLGGRREDYAHLVHSLSEKVSRGGIRKIVDGARRDVQWLYMTNQTGLGRYEGYSGSIAENPTLNFIVIINPNSGPGSPPWWPNADYVREIRKLNAYANVKTVGYIGTTYCQKPIEDVYAEISKYAEWSSDRRYPGLGVTGIFFDETPNLHTEAGQTYLESITQRVKETKGVLEDRMVIHNPGTAVDPRFAKPGPDVTTVAETDYTQFHSAEYQKWLATSPYERSRTSYMIHSAPVADVEEFVLAMRLRATYLFVTDLAECCYQRFGDSWKIFIAAMSSV